jgi:hypothetical protein
MEESTVLSNLIKTVKLNDNTFIEYYENRQVRKAENGEIIVQYYKRRLVGLFYYTIQKL